MFILLLDIKARRAHCQLAVHYTAIPAHLGHLFTLLNKLCLISLHRLLGRLGSLLAYKHAEFLK